MKIALWMLSSLAWPLGGFAALSLAMGRHHADVHGRGREPGRSRPWLRAAGALALGAGLLASAQALGWGQGPVLWLGTLTAAALAMAGMLTYRPRRAPALGAGAVAVAAIATSLAWVL